MSQIKYNPRTGGIGQVDAYIRYAGPYEDEYGNKWLVSILGLPEDVMSIMETRAFVLNAIPEEDHDAFEAQIYQAKLLEEKQDGRAYSEDDGVPQFPGLLVEIVLEELMRSGQHHAIQIVFDPKIWNNPHHWRIHLNSPSQSFSFSFAATQGSVTWTSSKSDGGKQWNAKVTRVTGNPAEYNNHCAAFMV